MAGARAWRWNQGQVWGSEAGLAHMWSLPWIQGRAVEASPLQDLRPF